MEKEYEMTNKEEKIQEQETLNLMKKYNNASPEYFERLNNLYKRRNYLVLISRIETESEKLIYLEKIKGDPTKYYSEIVWERNVDDDINFYLESHNFNLKDSGIKYLSELIKTLYHERKIIVSDLKSKIPPSRLFFYGSIKQFLISVMIRFFPYIYLHLHRLW